MEHIFRALPALLNEFDNNGAVREAVIFAAWRQVAGNLLCHHFAPLAVDEKRLTIAVTDNTWKRHLEELSPQMLSQINSKIGQAAIVFIEFRIDKDFVKNNCRPSASPSAASDNDTINHRVTVELLLQAEAIRDQELRQIFILAAGSCLERAERLSLSDKEND